jgi:membrane protein
MSVRGERLTARSGAAVFGEGMSDFVVGSEEEVGSAPPPLSRFSGAQILADLRWLVAVVVSSCDRFYWDNQFSKAAALAYSTLLSLVPVTALGFGILGSFAVSPDYIDKLRTFIFYQFVPSTQGVETVLQHISGYTEIIANLNAVVFVVLLFTSILLINSVEYALNEVWQIYEPRTIAHRIAIFSSILLLAPALALSAYYTATEFREASSWLGSRVGAIYNVVLPFLIDYLAFVSLYYLVPRAPVKLGSASFGALVAAALFGVAKNGFRVYIAHFASYAAIYGALASIPIFLVWLYLAWTVVLLGAEISYQYQYLPRSGRIWKRTVLSTGDGALLLSVQALVAITRAFVAGRKLPNDIELAELLGCSTVVLKPALDSLERAHLILRAETRDMPLSLMRSPDKITIQDIRYALSKQRTNVRFPDEMRELFDSFTRGSSPEQRTLQDIVTADRTIRAVEPSGERS